MEYTVGAGNEGEESVHVGAIDCGDGNETVPEEGVAVNEGASEGRDVAGETEIVESDYEQEVEDIATNTMVDLTASWPGFHPPNIPRDELHSESDVEDDSDDLSSLDGDVLDEEHKGKRRKFVNKDYHEFNPNHDMDEPKFTSG